MNVALDAYVSYMSTKGLDAKGFRTATLAHLAGVSTGQMSAMLQDYRIRQATGHPEYRYVIGCHEYGRNARWKILAKPGSDPKVVQQARREQAKWAARDAYNRITRDMAYELYPGLRGIESDDRIRQALDFAAKQHDLIVNFVEAVIGKNGNAA